MRFLLFLGLALTVVGADVDVARRPNMARVLETLKKDNDWTLQQQVSLCEIAAPPFKESVRAVEVQRRLKALGFAEARIDEVGNVIARYPGSGDAKPTLVYSAHLDTVFPEGMDVTVKKEGNRYRGLGIGDDCRGLATWLAVARAFRQADVHFTSTVYFVATVGEEGQGNLRGMHHLFEKEMAGKIDAFISVDGGGFSLVDKAVGSNRYKITYEGRGGHSWGAFGSPNPIHAMGRAIARIAEIEVPAHPKTTFNVGTVEGGTSVNSIPISASMEVDLRSESPKELQAVDERFKAALQAALEAEKKRWPTSAMPLDLKVESLGIRPAAAPEQNSLTAAAIAAGKAINIAVPEGRASSTDSNLPMSLGIPAITIGGGGRSLGAHSADEVYEETPDAYQGPQWAAVIIALVAGVQ